jgi:hypothetical protein
MRLDPKSGILLLVLMLLLSTTCRSYTSGRTFARLSCATKTNVFSTCASSTLGKATNPPSKSHSTCQFNNNHSRSRSLHMASVIDDSSEDLSVYSTYLKDVAKVSSIPTRLSSLLRLLRLNHYNLIPPTQRNGLIPFLIPLCTLENGSLLCFLRWPTQKDDMDLQLVQTTEAGVHLVSLGTDQYCRRILAEMNFNNNINFGKAENALKETGIVFQRDDYEKFIAKFPSETLQQKRLALDRYLLTKVGAFPDCYERMANNFLEQGSEVSALVTCERAVSVFYGWGHPLAFHSKMLNSIPGRQSEAKDVARTAMSCPKWTVASNKEDLEYVAKIAGFNDIKLVGEMHAYRANDPREKDIEEGVSPAQVN